MTEEHYRLAAALPRELHAHRETWTKGRLMAFLKAHTGLETVDRGAWFYARYRSGGGRPIIFWADFDALPMEEDDSLPYHSRVPGAAHKCGHDGHSAALAGFALELDRLGAGRPVFAGQRGGLSPAARGTV